MEPGSLPYARNTAIEHTSQPLESISDPRILFQLH
jgi:hypothetical protein